METKTTELRELRSPLLSSVPPGLSTVQPDLPATDQIYFQAYRSYKLTITLQALYSPLVALFACYLHFSSPIPQPDVYLLYLSALEIARSYYYTTLRLKLSDLTTYYTVADTLSHLKHVPPRALPPELTQAEPRCLADYDFTDVANSNPQIKLSVLRGQINKAMVNSSKGNKQLFTVQFYCYQLAHAIAIVLLLCRDFTATPAYQALLLVMVVVGSYRYIEFYLMLIYLMVVLPYGYLRNSYEYLVLRYRSYKTGRLLQSERYSGRIAGDGDCKICLLPYKDQDCIVTLKCHEMHNFHACCIKQWIQSSITCPICRTDLTQI